jgi:hypothetical protein
MLQMVSNRRTAALDHTHRHPDILNTLSGVNVLWDRILKESMTSGDVDTVTVKCRGGYNGR